MTDEVYRYNYARWEALANANALFTRPNLELTRESALEYLELERIGIPADLTGKRVLCLAGGGGQQSAAFALLGADVTVFDLSPSQLERDQTAAAHYGTRVTTIQGDMRDLSSLAEDRFDLVWHPYSIAFVPDPRVVFHEVASVLKEGGLYYFMCANPFFSGVTHADWNGAGYTVKLPYLDGVQATYADQEWVYDQSNSKIQQPVEYKQTLGTMMNSLIQEGFVLQYFSEIKSYDPDAAPGSWEHFMNVAPPWLECSWRYLPSLLKPTGHSGPLST